MIALDDVWANAVVAAAFVLGVIAGGIGVIRIMRYLLDYLKRNDGV